MMFKNPVSLNRTLGTIMLFSSLRAFQWVIVFPILRSEELWPENCSGRCWLETARMVTWTARRVIRMAQMVGLVDWTRPVASSGWFWWTATSHTCYLFWRKPVLCGAAYVTSNVIERPIKRPICCSVSVPVLTLYSYTNQFSMHNICWEGVRSRFYLPNPQGPFLV